MPSSTLYIVLMGVQGSGKGTQAAKLVERYKIPHVSTGDLFRAMKTQDTPLAREIQEIMNKGQLVPDDLTLQVVRLRLIRDDASHGVILDGFPRTRPQAEGLDNLLKEFEAKIKLVIVLDLDKATAVKRISDRWYCSADAKHNDGYNLSSRPPIKAGVCDVCGAALVQRTDDTPEAAEHRMGLYFQETAPLLDYYRKRGLLVEVDADRPIADVTKALFEIVDKVAEEL